MKPEMIDGLDYASASYHSMHGLIVSDWKKIDKSFNWNINIPPNTTALVFIPAKKAGNVKEGGKEASSADGVKFLRMEDDRAVFELGSGSYSFSAEN